MDQLKNGNEDKDMSSVAIMVEARGEDGECHLRVTAEQFFVEKSKQLKFQESMLGEAVAAFSKVSLEQRQAEQGV